jgi:inosose dehydratase
MDEESIEGAGMLNIGNAPLSWGVFEGDAPSNPAWETVLDEIAAAGYPFMELGPVGFLPEDTDLLTGELARRGLGVTAGFVYEHMHDQASQEHVLRTVRRVGRILSELEATYLVVIDRMASERQLVAGRSDAAQRLAPAQWTAMIETISEVARVADEEFGLRPVLHPHCGTHIEFVDEIDQALGDLPKSAIGLCVDTGHSAVAGLRASELVDRYPDRIEYFHFKDVDPSALRLMHNEGLGFEEALGAGLFCPLGQGVVDFAALRDSLRRIGFAGSATVEQDPDPRATEYSGLAAAKQSLEFLQETGLARDEQRSAGDRSLEQET